MSINRLSSNAGLPQPTPCKKRPLQRDVQTDAVARNAINSEQNPATAHDSGRSQYKKQCTRFFAESDSEGTCSDSEGARAEKKTAGASRQFFPPSASQAQASSRSTDNLTAIQNFKKTALEISLDRAIYRGANNFQLRPVEHSEENPSRGAHCQGFTVEGNTPLVANVLNKNLFIKIYHNQWLTGSDANLIGFVNTQVKHYNELRTKEAETTDPKPVPTALWYNAEKFKEDGYAIFEKLDAPPELTWTRDSSVESLTPEQRRLLDEIRDLFITCRQDTSEIYVDLKYDNLRLKNGRLVLSDYTESSSECGEFNYNARKFADTFAKKSKAISDYLFNAGYTQDPS